MATKDVPESVKLNRLQWTYRRRVIFSTLFFCAFCILYILYQGQDTRINETIAMGCFGLAGSVIGFYVAGASWTDVSFKKVEASVAPAVQSGKGPDDV